MSDEEMFLRAIVLSPLDDVPRLQYADWLEERGEPYGEFIRIQLELEKYPTDEPFPLGSEEAYERWGRLRERCGEFMVLWRVVRRIPEGRRGTSGAGITIYGASYRDCRTNSEVSMDLEVRRGFVDRVSLTLDHFIEYGKEIAELHPVTKWVLKDRRPDEVFRGSRYDWNWDQNPGDHWPTSARLPKKLWELLPRGDFSDSGCRDYHGNRWGYKCYQSVDGSFAALQQACYLYALPKPARVRRIKSKDS